MVYENVLQVIGNTPIVKLQNTASDLPLNLYVKLEFLNPGGSIKDRIGDWMIEDAVKRGVLKPGGTIVEGTSGNTGFGLAIAAAIRGYKCIFVLPDKMSQEKIRNLRAFGAKVVVTPTAVAPEDPRSYYSVSRRIAKETPNAVYLNQYDNLSNRDCHYKTTGPEILKQMPNIDYFFAGIGTGGTICGVGKYFKEKKPSIQVVAIDPIGSLVYDNFKNGTMIEAKPYKIEGIGEDFIPKNYDYSVIDDMVQVEDKESFLMTRHLLVKEGMFTGISSGCAVVGAMKWLKAQGDRAKGKNALIILPDSGNRYLSKVYNDDWMREAGFLEGKSLGTVQDLLENLKVQRGKVVMVEESAKISAVIDEMRANGISQVPIRDAKGWIKGILTEEAVLLGIYQGKVSPHQSVAEVMEKVVSPGIEFVTPQDSLEQVSQILTSGKIPLVTSPHKTDDISAIITKIDLLTYIGNRSL